MSTVEVIHSLFFAAAAFAANIAFVVGAATTDPVNSTGPIAAWRRVVRWIGVGAAVALVIAGVWYGITRGVLAENQVLFIGLSVLLCAMVAARRAQLRSHSPGGMFARAAGRERRRFVAMVLFMVLGSAVTLVGVFARATPFGGNFVIAAMFALFVAGMPWLILFVLDTRHPAAVRRPPG